MVSIGPAGIKENQRDLPHLPPEPQPQQIVAALRVTEELAPFVSLGAGSSAPQCRRADAVGASSGYRGCDGDDVHCLYPARTQQESSRP